MGNLIIFFIAVFSITAFAKSPSVSVYVGTKGLTKVSCSPLPRNFYKCSYGGKDVFINYNRYGSTPLNGVAVTAAGDVEFINYEKFEIDGKVQQRESYLPGLGYNKGKNRVYRDRKVKYDSISSLVLDLDYQSTLIGKNVVGSLKPLENAVNGKLESFKDDIKVADSVIKVGGKKYTCQNVSKNPKCFLSKCNDPKSRSKEKVYFIKSFSEFNPVSLQYYVLDSKGELKSTDFVTQVSFKGQSLPYYPFHSSNFFSGSYTTMSSSSYGPNPSIVTGEMKVPRKLRKQQDLFHQISNVESIKAIEDGLKFCPRLNQREFLNGLEKVKEKIAVSKMVQLIEKTNDGLQSNLVNEDLLPKGVCKDSDYYYEQEAKQDIDRFSASGPITPISMRKAIELFEQQKKRKDIAWNYQDDGCYARAHLMTRAFKDVGVISDKVWARGDFSMKALDGHEINWNYHVAPIVYVKKPTGRIEKVVIDPSVTDRPVSVSDWLHSFERKKSRKTPIEYTVYPLPDDAKSYERSVISYSNMLPISPTSPSNATEAELDLVARETMRDFLATP